MRQRILINKINIQIGCGIYCIIAILKNDHDMFV